MDDDTIAFFLIFIASTALIIGGVSYAYNTINPMPQQRVPSVMVLKTPDILKNRQIVMMPIIVPGSLGHSIDWICYFYHEESFTQKVTFNWWLGFQIEDEAQYISFYSSLGKTFEIEPRQKLECHISFSIKRGTPKTIVKKLEDAQIWLDINLEVVESG